MTTRTWYYAAIGSAPMRTELTKAAKKGGYSTLNVYMVEGYGIVLEYANFPEWSPSPLQWYSDGVYLNSNSVPGKVGDNGTIRNGKSLVREYTLCARAAMVDSVSKGNMLTSLQMKLVYFPSTGFQVGEF